jgi:hypothetical protein
MSYLLLYIIALMTSPWDDDNMRALPVDVQLRIPPRSLLRLESATDADGDVIMQYWSVVTEEEAEDPPPAEQQQQQQEDLPPFEDSDSGSDEDADPDMMPEVDGAADSEGGSELEEGQEMIIRMPEEPDVMEAEIRLVGDRDVDMED